MIATSIEQSKKLLELGLSPESADVSWLYVEGLKEMVLHINGKQPTENYLKRMQDRGIKKPRVPAWSLGALLELMPKDIILERSGYKYNHRLYLTYNYEAEKWTVLYSNKIWDDIVFFGKTSTDAAYNIVVWLLENNYIKKKKI